MRYRASVAADGEDDKGKEEAVQENITGRILRQGNIVQWI